MAPVILLLFTDFPCFLVVLVVAPGPGRPGSLESVNEREKKAVGVALYRGRVSCIALQAFMPRRAWFFGTDPAFALCCVVLSAPISDGCALCGLWEYLGPLPMWFRAAGMMRGCGLYPC